MSQDDDWLYEKQMAVIRVVATPRRHGITKLPFSLTPEDLALRILQTDKTSGVIRWYETRYLNADELMIECESVDLNGRIGLDASLTLLSRPGEEDRILQAIQATLTDDVELKDTYEIETEVLLTAPGYVPMVKQRSAVQDLLLSSSMVSDDSNDKELIVTDRDTQMFDTFGVSVCRTAVKDISSILTLVLEFIEELEHMFARRHADINYGQDDFVFQEIASRGSQRYDALLDLDNDSRWKELRCLAKETAPWLHFIRAILEDEWNVTVSLIYSRPGAGNQQWHCDGGHFANEAGFDGNGHAQPYGVCVFMPLIDLNCQVGFTQFFLKSHKTSKLIGFGGAAHLLAADFDGIVNAGEAVMYDYRLMHRGMANLSEDTLRPVLQFVYNKSHYAETKNYTGASMYS